MLTVSFSAPEADGWLITFANVWETKLSSIFIFDTAKLQDGPIAIIELPFRLRAGIHGSWVPGTDFLDRKDLCDMSGVTLEIRREYGENPVRTPFESNASESVTLNGMNGKH